jgi:hypothetical protein
LEDDTLDERVAELEVVPARGRPGRDAPQADSSAAVLLNQKPAGAGSCHRGWKSRRLSQTMLGGKGGSGGSVMNMASLRRNFFAYLFVLVFLSAWDWLEQAVGHVYRAVPIDLLRIPPLVVVILTMPLTDPNWRRQMHDYVVLGVSLLLMGSSLVGLVLLAGFHWEVGGGWAMANMAFGVGLALGVSIFIRSCFGRAPRNTGDDQDSRERPAS